MDMGTEIDLGVARKRVLLWTSIAEAENLVVREKLSRLGTSKCQRRDGKGGRSQECDSGTKRAMSSTKMSN